MFTVMLLVGLLTVLSSAGVVFSRAPLNSALSLVLTLMLIATHFALLGADFIAAMQIVVYAGAIMVLVIFVIMLLGVQQTENNRNWASPVMLFMSLVSVVAFVLLMKFSLFGGGDRMVYTTLVAPGAKAPVAGWGSTEAVGEKMLGEFIFPFEIASLLLLAAAIAAVVLAHEKRRPLPLGRGLRAKQEEYAEIQEQP